MPYIPPHKRNSNEAERPVLTPEKLAPLFKRHVNVGSSKSNNKRGSKVIYADRAISKWLEVGLDDDTQVPLEPFSLETFEQEIGEKLLALRKSCLGNGNELQWDLPKSPWVYMAENVLEDLLVSFENVREEMKSLKLECFNPSLVARVGITLFQGTDSVELESPGENLSAKMLKNWKRRSLFTPPSYTEKIVNEVVPNIPVAFESEKDTYQVQLADSTKPDLTLYCKCSVKDGKLQLYKVELAQVHHMVLDISIPTKYLDLRLVLKLKRILTSQTDDEMQSIRDLVDSAISDPDVKGGLRWPLGKTSSGKYSVVGVWHVRTKAYKNQSIRIKVKHADRFHFRISSGNAFWETSLTLKKVQAELKEEEYDVSSVSETLEENMKFIWDNFLT